MRNGKDREVRGQEEQTTHFFNWNGGAKRRKKKQESWHRLLPHRENHPDQGERAREWSNWEAATSSSGLA